ncbi:MAG: SxtJ family membrane protein, partial [Gammaproteobacteria bacterium]
MAGVTHTIPELDRQGLRHFGLVTGGIVAALFGLFFPWLLSRGFPIWPWVIFAVLAGWALVAPQTLRPVYRGWMRFGLLLSKITTPIILGVVFFVVIAPMAAVMRIARHDPLARKLDAAV